MVLAAVLHTRQLGRVTLLCYARVLLVLVLPRYVRVAYCTAMLRARFACVTNSLPRYVRVASV